MDERFQRWLAALEVRQLADLTFPEVARSLRALSSAYVERRAKLSEGAALSGRGKRAAFALFYGPLHYLLVHEVVLALGDKFTAIDSLVDLGCGTGASGAGWVTACGSRTPAMTGIDRHPWAIEEARRTFTDFGVRATTRMDDLTRVALDGRPLRPAPGTRTTAAPEARGGHAQRGRGVLLAFAVNEIEDAKERARLLARLLAHAAAGGRVVVVEPLAGFVAPWWKDWQAAFEAAGGHANEWKFRVTLPPIVEKLDRAAGLNHRELKGRSLSL